MAYRWKKVQKRIFLMILVFLTCSRRGAGAMRCDAV